MKTQVLLFCIFFISGGIFSQNDTLVASIIDHSREVESQGNYDYAVELIRSNLKNFKESPGLRKELVGLYFRGEEYRKSIRQCNKSLRKFGPDTEIYQYESHGYVSLGKTDRAEKTLKKGLSNLPNDGVLFTELGKLAMYNENYEDAIDWFEDGIQKAPNSPGNYYWASKIYLESTEEIWGLFYGEIFINLEPFTSRTSEISNLLYKTLNSEIIFYNDTAISVNLCKDANFTIPPEDTSNYVSYGQDIIEPLIKTSLSEIDHLTITNINKFRLSFLENYEEREITEYPNHFLIDFHNDLRNQGHFEAYNFWLFMMGSPKEFESWQRNNRSQWKLFIDWFEDYSFSIDASDFYYSKQFR